METAPQWIQDWHTYSDQRQQKITEWITANDGAPRELMQQSIEEIINATA